MILVDKNSNFNYFSFVYKILSVFLIAILVFSCEKAPVNIEPVEITGSTMGTTYSIKISDLPPQLTPHQLKSDIDRRLDDINQQMSTWQPDSILSRFNASTDLQWFDIPQDTLTVISESKRVSEISSGAFDVTVGGLVDLWGFGKTDREGLIPNEQEIKKQINQVNFKKVRIRRDPPAIKKDNPEITLNLSAIAKGYGVDQVAELLKKKNMYNFLVEIGGEIITSGEKQPQKPWIIAIERPIIAKRAIQKIILLKNRGLATSGDYRNYFEKEGKRYSHTIDPKTGRPIVHNLASVSVIHDSCMTADALATALMVMGPDKGYQLAVEKKLAIFMIIRTQKGFEEKTTLKFNRYFQP